MVWIDSVSKTFSRHRQVIRIGQRQRLDSVRRILFPCAFAGENPIDVVDAPNVEPNFNFDRVS
jgi:hypothetical protein